MSWYKCKASNSKVILSFIWDHDKNDVEFFEDSLVFIEDTYGDLLDARIFTCEDDVKVLQVETIKHSSEEEVHEFKMIEVIDLANRI